MSEDCDEAEVLALLEDRYARAILTETSAEPMSAQQLSERCDASEATIYRRVERLKACDLVEEQVQPQADGHHYRTFASRLESVTVEFEEGNRTLELEHREPPAVDPADRFTRLWEEL